MPSERIAGGPGTPSQLPRLTERWVLRCQPRFLDYTDQFWEVVAVISCAAHEVVGASDQRALFCVGGANEERRRSASFVPGRSRLRVARDVRFDRWCRLLGGITRSGAQRGGHERRARDH